MPEREPSKAAMALAESILVEVQVGHELWRKPGIATALDAFAQQAHDEALDAERIAQIIADIRLVKYTISKVGDRWVVEGDNSWLADCPTKEAAVGWLDRMSAERIVRALKSKPVTGESE